MISKEGIRKSEEFIEKVMKIEKPKTVKEMRQFLGLINFQRKFVKDCSLLTKPLSKWTSGPKSNKIEWSTEMEESFIALKNEIAKDIMLAYPDYRPEASKLEVYVDASGTGSGACLMQKRNEEHHVIAYASMNFSDTQRRYSTTDRELAAIRWSLQTFKPFLSGVPFIVMTDHKPLTYLHNMANNNSRLARTLEELAEFDFEVKYRPGRENQAADYLSRLRNEEDEKTIDEEEKSLPKELKRLVKIEGGGNSMFEALLVALKELKETDKYEGDIPASHKELRTEVVEELSRNMAWITAN